MDKHLHYVGDSSPNNLISLAPQWTANQFDYQDALMWADIIYSDIKKLAVLSQGCLTKGAYSLGKFLAYSQQYFVDNLNSGDVRKLAEQW